MVQARTVLTSVPFERGANHLPRPHLLAKLQKCVRYNLSLVCAPAGAGKTTLLRDFAEASEVAVAWCQLNRTSRDPAVLAERLLHALGVEPSPVRERNSLPKPWNYQFELPRLTHALSEAAAANHGQLVLILDDYHSVDGSEEVSELIAGLVELTPPGVHVIVSSRAVPPLPLARLRLNGGLLELTQDDLMLDLEEVSTFLEAGLGSRMSEDEERLVLDKTGGWIAGITLLTQSLRNRDKAEMIAFLREFSGGSSLVYDYFAEEVLRDQSPAIQQFLMATSLLGDLHRELVNPILRIDDAQTILETLAVSNAFIVCLDDNHGWYRYHPLFREFLRARAERSFTPAALRRLHHQASRVYSARKDWSRAIAHLCSAGSFDEAAAIVEREGEAHLEMGYLETVNQWLNSLPEGLRRERPALLLIEGMVAKDKRRYPDALRSLLQAQSRFAEVGDTSQLAAVASERAMISWRMRNYREAVDLLEYSLAAVSDTAKRAQTLARLSTTYKELGDLEQSVRFGEAALKALGACDSASRPGLESSTLRYLARTYMLKGNLDRALFLLLRANDLCNAEHIGEVERAYVIGDVGVVRAIRGEADLAIQAIREVEALDASRLELHRIRVNLWKGNVLTNLGELSEAERCYELAGFPAPECAWLYVRQQQPGRAILMAREALDEAHESDLLGRGILTAVLGLAFEASGQEAKGLGLLKEADALFEAHGYMLYLASLRLHVARILVETGQVEAGMRALHETVTTCESVGFSHFYWWDPGAIANLLQPAVVDRRIRRFADRLIERHPGGADRDALAVLAEGHGQHDPPAASEPRHGGKALGLLQEALASCKDEAARARIGGIAGADELAAECILKLKSDFGLTWREIEVFATYYLDRRFSSRDERGPLRRELASELCMTENTLKSHVKRIRRKLDLPDGADALQVYRSIVDPLATAI